MIYSKVISEIVYSTRSALRSSLDSAVQNPHKNDSPQAAFATRSARKSALGYWLSSGIFAAVWGAGSDSRNA